MKIKLRDSHPADSVKVEVAHGVWVVIKKRMMFLDDAFLPKVKDLPSLEISGVEAPVQAPKEVVVPVVAPVVEAKVEHKPVHPEHSQKKDKLL